MANSSHSTPDIWAPHLDKDETILWEGRPSAGIHMRRNDGWAIFAGVFTAAVAIGVFFLALDGLEPKQGEISAMLIMVFVVTGFFMAVALYVGVFQFYFAAKKRGRTYYAITNRRAMALTQGRKEKFEDGALDATTNLDYVPGKLASIYYKKTAKLRKNTQSDRQRRGQTGHHKVTYSTDYVYQGFELIPDGAVAYETMLKVMGAKLASTEPAKAGKSGEAWEDFLFEGEESLWEGGPGTGPRPTKLGVILTVIGLLIMYFAAGLISRTLLSGQSGSEVMMLGAFAVVVFLIGLWMAVGIWLLDIRKRKATRYALTNKRAFVAKALGGRNMLTYALVPHYRPLLLKGLMDEVTFGEEDHFDRKTGAKGKRAIAFKFLKDGQEVYDIITKASIAIDAEAEAQV